MNTENVTLGAALTVLGGLTIRGLFSAYRERRRAQREHDQRLWNLILAKLEDAEKAHANVAHLARNNNMKVSLVDESVHTGLTTLSDVTREMAALRASQQEIHNTLSQLTGSRHLNVVGPNGR